MHELGLLDRFLPDEKRKKPLKAKVEDTEQKGHPCKKEIAVEKVEQFTHEATETRAEHLESATALIPVENKQEVVALSEHNCVLEKHEQMTSSPVESCLRKSTKSCASALHIWQLVTVDKSMIMIGRQKKISCPKIPVTRLLWDRGKNLFPFGVGG